MGEVPEENLLVPEAPTEADPATSPAPEQAAAEPHRSFIAEWVVTILLFLFAITTLVQNFVIPTGSMEDTLLVGDHVLVDKLAYAPPGPVSKYLLPYTPVKRGDIVVFRYPVDTKQMFVKRVIGIPGDRIRIENKQVYLNGVALEEPYKFHKSPGIQLYRDIFPSDPAAPVDERAIDMLNNHVSKNEVIVPPAGYFVMGDNRDHSLDSRYWGFVPRENIVGKPVLIYWSYAAQGDWLMRSFLSVEYLKDLSRNFIKKTRWDRSFKLIRGFGTQDSQ
ncbi:MAG: signal peptidase I [Bryobacterales bacterium]|nr:signal peptidase I [Bryobacterales bacterium]